MKELKVFPMIGLFAAMAGKSGSFRAWIIARNLDNGTGRFLKVRLNQAIEDRTTKRTRQRWIKEALQLGIFTVSRCGKYLRYISVDKVARVYHAPNIVKPIIVKSDDLFSPGWHGLLWAGYLDSRNDQQPISRETLERITGVQIRTQINLEKDNELIVKYHCQAVLGKVSDPQNAFENLQNNPDPSIRIKGNKIIKQLPNTYKTRGVRQAKKGSTGKYSKLLKFSLSKSQREPDNKIRVFFKNQKRAYQAARKYNQVKYCFIRQDSQGINLFSEVNYI